MPTLAFSPCPNDAFAFHALAAGLVETDGLAFDVHLHDIETLNELALAETYDVTKVSFPAYFRVRDRYRLLEAGAAMGFGCGPLLVGKTSTLPAGRPARVAVPGAWTTADLLLRLWAPVEVERVQVRFDRVMEAVLSGAADAGVLIHEGRFVFERFGLVAVEDLGAWWEREAGLPVPLAGIVARRSLDEDAVGRIEAAVRRSVETARRDPPGAMAYVRHNAPGMDDEVLRRHIETYVTDFSIRLGDAGRAAVDRLEAAARDRGCPS